MLMTSRGSGCGLGVRLLLAALIALGSLFGYCTSRSENPITGEVQHVALSADEEIALGLHAAPEMAAQHGGFVTGTEPSQRVETIGGQLVAATAAADSPYRFEFHLLADTETINAFALPGGQIFITRALAEQLETDAQLAGVLAHEIGHVVGRHASEQIAKAQLTQGLTGAAVVAAYDPDRPNSRAAGYMAQLVGQLVTLKFGREDELESDRLAVRFMVDAGYDPRAMIGVLEILKRAGGGSVEFFSTHPNPDHRIERIQAFIRDELGASGG